MPNYLIKIAIGLGVFWLLAPAPCAQISAGEIQSLLGRGIQSYRDGQRNYLIATSDFNSALNRAGEAGAEAPDPWLGKDKCKHFVLSGFWSGFGYLVCHRHFQYSRSRSRFLSGGIVLSLGVAKEIRDGLESDNRFSYRDLIFDLVGTGCGLFLASR